MTGQARGNGGEGTLGERDHVLGARRRPETDRFGYGVPLSHAVSGQAAARRSSADRMLPPVSGQRYQASMQFTCVERTLSIRRAASRLCGQLAWAALHEVPLPNGRRADILALRPDGGFTCIEVKSGVRDFLTDGKWPDTGLSAMRCISL